jgi:hypothetical protein
MITALDGLQNCQSLEDLKRYLTIYLKQNTQTVNALDKSAASSSDATKVSRIRVNTGNGHGAVYNTVRRFSVITESIGTAITYLDSPNYGANFTINEDGEYSIGYVDSRAGTAVFGISLNSSQLTTSIDTINDADALVYVTASLNTRSHCGITRRFSKGNVLRAQDDGNCDNTGNGCRFFIEKVGP